MKHTIQLPSRKLLRWATPLLLLALATTPLLAQGKGNFKGKGKGGGGPEVVGGLPAGWSVRADAGDGAANLLTTEGDALHFVTGGPPTNNGTYYNPAWTSTGNHTYSATFTQNVKATHPDAYGLMIGGTNLGAENQSYTYFEVRQAGEFYIANRDGATVTPVVPWTKNAAIQAEGADGKQMNTLSIEINGANAVFSVNGTEVSRQPTSAVKTDGLYGFRVSHRLDITVTDIKK